MIDARLDRIDQYLSSGDCPEGSMMLSDLDGFIFGLVCSPEPIPAPVWLNFAFGGDLEEVPAAVINDITDYYMEVAKDLSGSEPDPMPVFYENDKGDVIAMDWCEGFMDAVKLSPEAWLKLSDSQEHGHLMSPILAHIIDDDGKSLLGVSGDQLKELLDEASAMIPDNIIGIYRFWRS